MLNTLTRYWWIVALRGLCGVLFGLMALLWPGITLGWMIILFGAYSLANGVMALISAVQHRDRWWSLTLEGLAGVAAAVVTFMWPGITGLALLYVIAAWAIVTGVLELVAAIRLRKVIPDELLLGLSGLASIGFGVLLMVWPGAGALAVAWLIGVYALVFGGLLIGLAFRLRSKQRHTKQPLQSSPSTGDSRSIGLSDDGSPITRPHHA